MMRRNICTYSTALILVIASLLGLSGCDIHEYPVISETVEHEVHLQFNAETMFDWTFSHDWDFETDNPTKADQPKGRMRYIIRLYPVSAKGRTASAPVQEHLLYGDVHGPYGGKFSIHLLPGEYDMMVWADWEIPGRENEFYHDASDFSNITLTTHHGNTNYRDAFRGTQRITVLSDMYEHEREPIVIRLERPFAKFEIITNDLSEFITKQLAILHAKEEAAGATKGDMPTKTIDLDDYEVVIYYPGYMPSAFNMFIDKPVDSMTGVSFKSKLTRINEKEARMGFDYVLVNGADAAVTVQVGLFDKEGEQLALSSPMNIPLLRNKRTVVRGSFLMQKASGSVGINPDFDDEYNYEITW